jgi:hypothetical protein
VTVRACLVALAACGGTASVDAGSDALLVPPDGTAACDTPIAFDTWTYAMRAAAGFPQPIEHPTFLASDRVVFASNGHLFDWDTEHAPTQITSLDLPDSSKLQYPSAAPGGHLFWFARATGTSAGLYAAVESGGDWIAMRAQLGSDALVFEPGAAAFFAGGVRMVVINTQGGRDGLLELTSQDGIAWTQNAVIEWPGLSADFGDPALTPDGCQLLLSRLVATGAREIQVSNRRPDGTFAPPVRAAPTAGPDVAGPTLDPTLSKMWFVEAGQIVQGTP